MINLTFIATKFFYEIWYCRLVLEKWQWGTVGFGVVEVRCDSPYNICNKSNGTLQISVHKVHLIAGVIPRYETEVLTVLWGWGGWRLVTRLLHEQSEWGRGVVGKRDRVLGERTETLCKRGEKLSVSSAELCRWCIHIYLGRHGLSTPCVSTYNGWQVRWTLSRSFQTGLGSVEVCQNLLINCSVVNSGTN